MSERRVIAADDPVWGDVIELAAIAARPIARKFRGFTEFDDLKQAACEYALRREDKVLEYLYEYDCDLMAHVRRDQETRRQGETAMITFMRRYCERVARREKAERAGYQTEDEYFYRPMMVENLIKVWGSGDYDTAGQVLDPSEMGGRRQKTASEGNNLLAMVADVDAAMKHMDDRDRFVLVERFVYDRTLADIAKEMDLSTQRVDQLSDRGVRKVINFLGGANPY